MREHLGDDVRMMVDANQQWDRPTAMRMGRIFEQFNLVWIEEPLDAYDAEGHAQLARSLDTAIATGEMLASVGEHIRLIEVDAVDIIQPDAPRIGGFTQFIRLAPLAEQKNLQLAPHFAMEIHLHLAATYPHGGVGRALRLARPAVQRAPRDPRRTHAPLRPPRPRLHPQRPSARLDRGDRRVRPLITTRAPFSAKSFHH